MAFVCWSTAGGAGEEASERKTPSETQDRGRGVGGWCGPKGTPWGLGPPRPMVSHRFPASPVGPADAGQTPELWAHWLLAAGPPGCLFKMAPSRVPPHTFRSQRRGGRTPLPPGDSCTLKFEDLCPAHSGQTRRGATPHPEPVCSAQTGSPNPRIPGTRPWRTLRSSSSTTAQGPGVLCRAVSGQA